MHASFLIDTCVRNGIDFFTGVPDSLLKALCNELYERFGTAGDTHIVAHNEGGAVALCAGHYLASGRPGLCYMQNSGLGNAVNPLASLMDPEVYGLPCLLVIGWRGEPGVKDEPQHIKQGAVTPGQLDLLGVPYFILSADTTDESFLQSFDILLREMNRGQTAAIIVRKGALDSTCSPDYSNAYSMTRETAVSLILASSRADDIFVSTTGKLSREIFELREARGERHEKDFLTVGSMGHAAMIAFRIAAEKPDRRIWCLDGDGAALMHLGVLPIIGGKKPPNLVHVIINNGAHETVGGMPVCSGSMKISALAEAAGYPSVFSADSADSLQSVLKSISGAQKGLLMIEIRCACGSRAGLGRPTTTPAMNRDAFMSFLK